MRNNDSDYSDSDEDSISSSDSVLETTAKKIPLSLNKVKNNIETYESDDGEDGNESESVSSEESSSCDENDNDCDDVDNEEDTIGGGDSDIEEEEEEEEEEEDNNQENNIEKKLTSKNQKSKKKNPIVIEEEGIDDDDDNDEYDENYLQKFDSEITKNYITEFHPECLNNNYDEIAKLCVVVRNSDNIIIDPLHKTIPFLTKYEKARILGQRAKQIETGAKPFVKVPENIIDSYIIAELELREKKIPFIIKRPIPSGGFEYWYLKDLENIDF